MACGAEKGVFMQGDYEQEATFALEAVSEAAKLCRRVQQRMVSAAMSKSDRSPVTVADFASQALFASRLQEAFPGDVLVAEEDSLGLRAEPEALEAVHGFVGEVHPGASIEQVCAWIDRGQGEPKRRFWTLDPIDGTKGFLRGDQYVVAAALIIDGEVRAGAMACPNLNRRIEPEVGGEGCALLAVRGAGTWAYSLDGEPGPRLRVSEQADPRQARVLRSFESGHTNEALMGQILEIMGVEAPAVLMDSQAKYAILAAGGGELLFRLLSPARPDYAEKIWDQAAGSIVLEEAGGVITDLRGERLDFSQGRELRDNIGVLASNGRLHAAGLRAVRAVGADRRPRET